MDTRLIIVEDGDQKRLDIFLSGYLSLTRSYIKQLIDKKNVTLNSEIVKSGKTVKKGDNIIITIPEVISTIIPQNIPLDILYEDDDIAVINKQQGLTVHPGGGADDGTLVNALMYHLKSLSTINGVIRPGIVHRLDKNTSGVMVVAKNDAAHLNLANQIADRKFIKIYYAIVDGVMKEDEGVIKTKIGRNPKERKQMCVTADGREAITKFKVIERFKEYTFARFNILTGRTHQIRVHAKHINHPVTGDEVYGSKKQKFNTEGQLLHSYSLTFTHPSTNETATFIAPLPNHFEKVLEILRKNI